MGEPTWTEIKTIRVPDRTGGVWIHALDWIAATKLYRVEVRPTRPQGEAAGPGPKKASGAAREQEASGKGEQKDGSSDPPAAIPQAAEVKKGTSTPVAPAATGSAGNNTSTPVPGPDAPKEVTRETEGAHGDTGMAAESTRTEPQAGDNGESNDGNLKNQTWTPLGSNRPCTADGDFSGLSRRDALIIPGARLGTLICKIGGSTADLVLDPNSVTVFPVGRFCVFKAPDEGKTGPLYLGINDSPAAAAHVEGSLEVVISLAL